MEYSKQLIEKIQEKKARVCIIGLGNVGLKLATEIAEEGYITFGIDIDEYKIKLINEGFSYINDVSELTIKKLIKSEVF